MKSALGVGGLLLALAGMLYATAPAAGAGPTDQIQLGAPEFQPSAQRPVGWRGDWTGRYPGANPPLVWAKDKNVVWHSAPIERWAKPVSSPIIVGDKIFLVTTPADLVCLDKATGKVLWIRSNNYYDALPEAQRKENPALVENVAPLAAKLTEAHEAIVKLAVPGPVPPTLGSKVNEAWELDGKIYEQMHALDKKYTRTHVDVPEAPTPCSDGQHVFVWFGQGVAACYDLDGTRRWITMENRCPGGGGHHGYHASPALVGGKLVTFMVDLLAFDAATGKLAWSTPIKTVMGSNYHSSIPFATIDSEPTVLVTENEGPWLGIKVADGTRLWTSEKFHPWTCGTPVLNAGTLYIDGGKGFAAYQLPTKAGEHGKLLQTKFDDKDLPVASPLYHDGLVYGIGPKGLLRVFDAATAQLVYDHQLEIGTGANFYPSVTLAGKYIFITNNNGETEILEPGRTFKSVGINTLGEGTEVSPIFEGTRMYLRTNGGLYCIAAS